MSITKAPTERRLDRERLARPDIRALMAADAPISGSILGRALYDGDIVASEALAAAG